MINMKKSALYLLCIVTVFVFITDANSQENETEKAFVQAGLIDIHVIDESIQVNLVNSDPDKNYFRENFYNGLTKAYLREEVAKKLSMAQQHLKSNMAGWSLLVMDAARPRSVSQQMYDTMKGTKFERFVANPKHGSMHNYGIAVDITIIDEYGQEIDMGFTPFYKSNLSIYWNYVKFKIFGLNETQKTHRQVLSDVMKKAGFIPLPHEWWHFNGMPKHEARKKYQIIE